MTPQQIATALAFYLDYGQGALKRVRAALSLGLMPRQTDLVEALQDIDRAGERHSDDDAHQERLARLSCSLCEYLT